MTCPKCSTENDRRATHCSSCGEALASNTTQTSTGIAVSAAILGLLSGIGATVALYAAGALFDQIGGPHSRQEFESSRGSAWFWLLSLIGVVIALFVIFRSRRIADRSFLRVFTLSALFFMLGGMTLCNLFSISTIFDRSP